MAENIATERNGKGKRPAKKSTRVDLTPMVDLGFLLITFFVFTTVINTPKAMSMKSPIDKDPAKNKICESCAITVISSANNRLYYYEGTGINAEYKTTDYSSEGLRALLQKKKKETAAIGRTAVLIIKPGRSSSFKNLINIIDENNIAAYPQYYLDNLNEADRIHTE